MKKNVLKSVAALAVLTVAVWNIGLNETKIFFLNSFEVEALAKTETFCKNGRDNTGICRTNLDESTGRTCMSKDKNQTANCYGTGSEEVK